MGSAALRCSEEIGERSLIWSVGKFYTELAAMAWMRSQRRGVLTMRRIETEPFPQKSGHGDIAATMKAFDYVFGDIMLANSEVLNFACSTTGWVQWRRR